MDWPSVSTHPEISPNRGHDDNPPTSCCSRTRARTGPSWKSWTRSRRKQDPYLQPQQLPPFRRRRRGSWLHSVILPALSTLLLFSLCCRSANAAFIDFENCLDPNIINSQPVQLQFVPLFLYANFNATDPNHNLNVTVYGNVTGSATTTPPPPSSDPQWSNPNETTGKIVDLSASNNKYSTLFAKFNVLSYTPYEMTPIRFCESVVQDQCPLGPAFGANASDAAELPAFSVAHLFNSSYAFTTLSTTLRVASGDASNAVLACVSANITPQLGPHLSKVLAFMPLAILILVGVATAFAAILSPWGSTDTFRWTSNYGRDEDLLRLVTPGFGDCLQYIQFAVLTGALSLSYPGFYQPVVSQASWATLMFNTSFVSHGNGTRSLVDGVYVTHGEYGLERLSELVGLSSVKDIWAGAAVWLLVILAIVVVCTQAGFALRWGYRHISNTQEEDLRAKNLPFTVGNVIRIVFNYFLLPMVVFSMFQLVVAGVPPLAPYTTALAVVLLLALIGFGVWLLRLIASVRPRSYLFDDLPTVLLYGPLYNTYSDNAAPFALVPVFLTFFRGIAIGAVQHSGIAQLVLLAICEVILILTLHAFRPFHSRTSNNAYHTFFAIVRLLTTLLSVAFVPSLGVTEAPKGWIGYVILLMHAIVLVFGFFLNALQTIVEVGARLAGAGGDVDVGGGAARGGLVKVFGMRQLSRRMPRRQGGRDSGVSDAELLASDADRKSNMNGGRARSMSGSSAVLLNRHTTSDGRTSAGLDSMSASAFGQNRRGSGSAYTPTTPGAQSTFSYMPGGPPASGSAQSGIVGLKTADTADPYYRPPRKRTFAEDSPGARSRGSWASGDWMNQRWSQTSAGRNGAVDPIEGPSISGRGTPVPAYLAPREVSDSNVNDHRRDQTDYAVREVDFYYGVRGPALSTLPTRRLGTGPADPTGPVASAAGWFKGLFGGKTKDKGKGFEVVRSTRAPPPGASRGLAGVMPQHGASLSQDHELGPGQPRGLGQEQLVNVDEIGRAVGPENDMALNTRRGEDEEEYDSSAESEEEDGEYRDNRVSEVPPSLPGIDTGGAIELPSRRGSRASSQPSRSARKFPNVPRKSSKRKSTNLEVRPDASNRLSSIRASPPTTPRAPETPLYDPFPPRRDVHAPMESTLHAQHASDATAVDSNLRGSTGGDSIGSSLLPGMGEEEVGSPTTHARHSSSIFPADAFNEQRTSLGYVQQHRASDNVHNVMHDGHDGVNYVGSSAEVVSDPAKSLTHSERDSAR